MSKNIYYCLLITISSTALGASLVLPLLPVYAQDLGATGTHLGLIFSSFALARSLVLPLVGQFSDTVGRRKILLGGLLVYTAIAVAFAMAGSVLELVLCRLVQGAGAAMVLPVARAYAGDMAPPGQEGRVMGHFNMAFFGGLALGPWMGGFLKDLYGIQVPFLSMGALGLFGFLLSLRTLPREQPQADVSGRPQLSYLEMLRNPAVASMFLFRFGTIIGVGVNWTFTPLFAHDQLLLSSSEIGILISLTVVMTSLFQPVFGRLADRLNRAFMTAFGGVCASLCLLGIPFCTDFYHLLLLNALAGVTAGVYMAPLMAMAVDVGRESGYMTRVMSLLELAFSLGMVVGPLLAGMLKELAGLDFIFWFGGFTGCAFSVLFLSMYLKTNRVKAVSPLGSDE